MQIYGPSQIHSSQAARGPHASRSVSTSSSARPSSGDQVQISAAAEAAVQAAESGEVRSDLVARVRGEIAAGTYETAEKLDAALERLLDQIG